MIRRALEYCLTVLYGRPFSEATFISQILLMLVAMATGKGYALEHQKLYDCFPEMLIFTG
jgi:hypothetical protein